MPNVNDKLQIRGIAEGIQVLHSMDPPIIHGELRAVRIFPHNRQESEYSTFPKEKVLIGNEGQPLLTDFALAKARFVSSAITVSFTSHHGRLRGT